MSIAAYSTRPILPEATDAAALKHWADGHAAAIAVCWTHRVGAQCRGTAAPLPADGDGQRNGGPVRGGGGARMGEHRRLLVRQHLEHEPLDPRGRRGRLPGSPRVG